MARDRARQREWEQHRNRHQCNINVALGEKARWQACAGLEGVSLTDWMRECLNREAALVEFDQQRVAEMRAWVAAQVATAALEAG